MTIDATNCTAPDFSALAASRRSIRAYTDQQIPQDILDAILKDATTAPSWSNTRAFRVALATGSVRIACAKNTCVDSIKPWIFNTASPSRWQKLPCDANYPTVIFPSGSLTHASFAQLKLKSPSVYMAPMVLNAAITRGATQQTVET